MVSVTSLRFDSQAAGWLREGEKKRDVFLFVPLRLSRMRDFIETTIFLCRLPSRWHIFLQTVGLFGASQRTRLRKGGGDSLRLHTLDF